MHSLFQDQDLINKLIVLGQQAETNQQQVYNTALQMINNLKQDINNIFSSKPLDGQALSSLDDLKEWLKTSATTINGIKIFDPSSNDAAVSRVDGFYLDGLTEFLQDLRNRAEKAKDIRLAGMTENLIEDTNKAGLTKLPPKSEQASTEAPKQEQSKAQQAPATSVADPKLKQTDNHQRSSTAPQLSLPFNGSIFSISALTKFANYLDTEIDTRIALTIKPALEGASGLNPLIHHYYNMAISKTPGVDIIAVSSSSSANDAANALKATFDPGQSNNPSANYSSKELGNIALVLSNISYQAGLILKVLRSDPQMSEQLGSGVLDNQISMAENYVKIFRATNSQLMMEHRNAIR